MAVQVADYEAALEVARAAVGTSSWQAARVAVTQARIIAAALPRTTVDGATVDYKEQIQDIFAAIDEAEIAAARGGNRITTTRTAHSRRGNRGRGTCNDGHC